MVDCRPAAGAPPHELAHSAPNGGPPPPPPENSHHNQVGGSGDMAHGVASPAGRASTPASTTAIATYAAGNSVPHPGMPGNMGNMGNMGYGPYYKGGVVWVPPAPLPPPVPPPPPHHVNPHVFKSVQLNGADLPMNDIPTLRYYFNLGVEYMWAYYGPPPPPRHYSPRDIAQEMQQMSLAERSGEAHKHKAAADGKPLAPPAKGNGQRSLLGPRFNKRGNQDGNQNPNHNQNKGHNNNNMANKGPNNRRNSHESRGPPGAVPQYNEGECVVEAPILSVPYMPYPPPVYPIQYYPVDSGDPGMMGMMGGMGYVNYEEGGEFVQPYYPHPLYPPHPAPAPPPPHHLALHHDHK